MPDYKSMYYRLAGKVADAVDILVEALQEGEECAMESEEAAIEVFTGREKPGNENRRG